MATTGTIEDSSQVTRRETQRERDIYYTIYLTAAGGRERGRVKLQFEVDIFWGG